MKRPPRIRDRQSCCYGLPVRAIPDEPRHPRLVQVHGRDRGRHGRLDHVWMEIPSVDQIYGAALNGYRSREAYYQRFAAQPLHAYSRDGVAHHPLTFNHFGPWGERQS